ncbi:hypothetical protein [Sinorhizobium medicae]|uniref:Phosphoribosylformylglycinamidine synthase n=1 Tax=Sinorhizobium medicae TaxID=110321 RepID=A0A508WWU3_9HYPH|nr:hypothetical protein [Sinorhizobium medicae]VTZ61775.1 Phosphoribosylformylglycinamidine synthase [Sinorhizobium medicae]
MSNVVRLDPVEVGSGYRFDADEILEGAKGKGMKTLAVIGELPDGTTWVSGTANAGETLILMERAKRVICFGEE